MHMACNGEALAVGLYVTSMNLNEGFMTLHKCHNEAKRILDTTTTTSVIKAGKWLRKT